MSRRQTKIIATISDRACDVELIRSLHQAGMSVVRLNTAHQTPPDTLRVVEAVRAVSEDIALLLDTKGPEVRTAGLEEPLVLAENQRVLLGDAADAETGTVEVGLNVAGLAEAIPVGAAILIDDGELELRVTETDGRVLVCEAVHPGAIKNRKSVNVPGVHLPLPALSARDREYVDFAMDHDLDFIAHSFVRDREDVLAIQRMLDARQSRIKIIAKIENREGVDNLEEILEVAYGVMIARGDLGIEIAAEEVPAIQKRIIASCIHHAQPVITATQMLHSMIENPRPTRAEVSDVANAVFDGTDALMLSGETAYGKYPEAAVRTMARIAEAAEAEKPPLRELPKFEARRLARNYLARCAVKASLELSVQAIVIDTSSGYSARIVAAYRGHVPVFAITHDRRVRRELALSHGIYPFYLCPIPETTDELVHQSLTLLLEAERVAREDTVAILAGTPHHNTGANFLEINPVHLCLGLRS